ncbi:hypothetical protein LZG04_04545 [Saccharothrix sp. S26]|uniref:hypothetical protein n=1 Tax=Saccharothrix sp. S26 TaxID=2907215 RepID=UPI001F25F5D0|nr:hypothetical protein [Saccharothrix sp. S26]MCE6994084.1 hypothetical protein [Saccharothrix sp. S26]
MDEPRTPVTGMTISVRTRRDVVVVDPDRFLAAARSAYRELNPGLTDAEVAEAVADVTDAAFALVERHGDLAPGPDRAGDPPLPGTRLADRPGGLSPAGRMRQVVLDERPLQDYGCFLPDDVFAPPTDH